MELNLFMLSEDLVLSVYHYGFQFTMYQWCLRPLEVFLWYTATPDAAKCDLETLLGCPHTFKMPCTPKHFSAICWANKQWWKTFLCLGTPSWRSAPSLTLSSSSKLLGWGLTCLLGTASSSQDESLLRPTATSPWLMLLVVASPWQKRQCGR